MSQIVRRSKQGESKTRPRAPRVDVAGLARYFAAQPDVVVAYLFGSVARGTARPQSDVDIAVLFDAQLEASERDARYFSLLGRVLERFTTAPVDVRLLNDATPLFCFQVIKYGKVIYARTRAERIAFQVSVMTQYEDTKQLSDFFTRDLYRRFREGRFGERRENIHSRALETARRLYAQVARTSGD